MGILVGWFVGFSLFLLDYPTTVIYWAFHYSLDVCSQLLPNPNDSQDYYHNLRFCFVLIS